MTLWMSKLDERGRPKRSLETKCVKCGIVVNCTTPNTKYCRPCATAMKKKQDAEWYRRAEPALESARQSRARSAGRSRIAASEMVT